MKGLVLMVVCGSDPVVEAEVEDGGSVRGLADLGVVRDEVLVARGEVAVTHPKFHAAPIDFGGDADIFDAGDVDLGDLLRGWTEVREKRLADGDSLAA